MSDTVPSFPAPSGAIRLKAIAGALSNGDSAPAPTIREFLGWFGAMRRGQFIVQSVRYDLKQAGLLTVPDFESAFIDGPITFVLVPVASVVELEHPIEEKVATTALATPIPAEEAPVSVGIEDPTYRLSKLAAANNNPVSVAPDRPVVDAVTLMLANDFSQLPVMTNVRTVKGMISWRSIGARWALGREGSEVRQYMEDFVEIPAERSIFLALPLIVEHGYVLVRDGASKISGIVTTADISHQFQQLAEPFLLLGEIENHVRRLMDGRFTKEELATAKDPSDEDREIASVYDLTFGEYLWVLQEPAHWAKLGIEIDRAIFIKSLDAVRIIRNDVMHFDPDPLPDSDLLALRRFAKFLQTLQSLHNE